MRSTSQKTRQMKAAVEAILFAMGGSVEVEKIAAALEMELGLYLRVTGQM